MPDTAVYDPITISEAIMSDVTDSITEYASDQAQADSNLHGWLTKRLQAHDSDAARTASEIVDELRNQEAHLVSIKKASAEGISNESWLTDTLEKATASVSAQATAGYYQEIGHAVGEAEQALLSIVRCKDGSINQNPNLDGLIAEEFHTHSFNVNAAGRGSDVRATTRSSTGKNSVDIAIHDSYGVIQNYQVKYGKTAADTIRMLKDGNYNNQRLVVPPEQVDAVKKAFPNKTVVSTLEYNKILSDALSKAEAKKLQILAQTDPAAYERYIKKLYLKKL